MHRPILKYDKKATLMHLIKLQKKKINKKLAHVGFEPTPMRPDLKTAQIVISFRDTDIVRRG